MARCEIQEFCTAGRVKESNGLDCAHFRFNKSLRGPTFGLLSPARVRECLLVALPRRCRPRRRRSGIHVRRDKAALFPVGARPTRRSLQPEATGAGRFARDSPLEQRRFELSVPPWNASVRRSATWDRAPLPVSESRPPEKRNRVRRAEEIGLNRPPPLLRQGAQQNSS
jgi:hypothetical protein